MSGHGRSPKKKRSISPAKGDGKTQVGGNHPPQKYSRIPPPKALLLAAHRWVRAKKAIMDDNMFQLVRREGKIRVAVKILAQNHHTWLIQTDDVVIEDIDINRFWIGRA